MTEANNNVNTDTDTEAELEATDEAVETPGTLPKTEAAQKAMAEKAAGVKAGKPASCNLTPQEASLCLEAMNALSLKGCDLHKTLNISAVCGKLIPFVQAWEVAVQKKVQEETQEG